MYMHTYINIKYMALVSWEHSFCTGRRMFPAQSEDQGHRVIASDVSEHDDREAKSKERDLEAWLDDMLA